MLNFLLIQLDFESYFIKLIFLGGHISRRVRLILRLLVPKPEEVFSFTF